jgi:hypothetical protein
MGGGDFTDTESIEIAYTYFYFLKKIEVYRTLRIKLHLILSENWKTCLLRLCNEGNHGVLQFDFLE